MKNSCQQSQIVRPQKHKFQTIISLCLYIFHSQTEHNRKQSPYIETSSANIFLGNYTNSSMQVAIINYWRNKIPKIALHNHQQSYTLNSAKSPPKILFGCVCVYMYIWVKKLCILQHTPLHVWYKSKILNMETLSHHSTFAFNSSKRGTLYWNWVCICECIEVNQLGNGRFKI